MGGRNTQQIHTHRYPSNRERDRVRWGRRKKLTVAKTGQVLA